MSAIICDPAAIEAALRTEGQIDRNAAQYTFLHQSSDLTVIKVVMPGQLESPPHNHLAWVVIGMYRGARGKRLLSKERERRFRIEQARAGRA
jgi:predicted metal-dependent enzyme (double-stranded beta helix superfamily)